MGSGVQRPLRFRSLWLTIGWVLVLLVLYLSLTPRPLELQIEQGDKYSHLLAYFVLMAWFQQLYPTFLNRLVLLMLFVGMGVGIEFLQGMSGVRFFDPADMVANTLGALLAWSLGWTSFSSLLSRFEERLLPRRGDG